MILPFIKLLWSVCSGVIANAKMNQVAAAKRYLTSTELDLLAEFRESTMHSTEAARAPIQKMFLDDTLQLRMAAGQTFHRVCKKTEQYNTGDTTGMFVSTTKTLKAAKLYTKVNRNAEADCIRAFIVSGGIIEMVYANSNKHAEEEVLVPLTAIIKVDVVSEEVPISGEEYPSLMKQTN
jgi:hypothetical protein